MNFSLFFAVLACLSSIGWSEQVLDVLMDSWLLHARNMLNSTRSKEVSIKGIQFYAPCGALLTRMNCSVTADTGIVNDLSTVKRYSTVTVNSVSDKTAQIDVSLTYDVLGIHYPNMLIQGSGIRMEYKGIDVRALSSLPIRLSMHLDYSKGVKGCTNSFKLSPPSNNFQLSITVQQPALKLPLNSDITKNIAQGLIKTAMEHISSVIDYENVCTKLANVF